MLGLNFLLAMAALLAAIVIWRIRSPGDWRITRRYIGRFVKDGAGRGPTRLRVKPLPVWQGGATSEETVFLHARATFADQTERTLTVQILYPLDELQKQREQRQKPFFADSFDVTHTTAQPGGGFSPTEEAEKFREDPLRELTEEHQIIDAKTAQMDAEMAGLKIINSCTDLFPELIAYDRKRHIAVLEGVGDSRLDSFLAEQDPNTRSALLGSLLTRIARFHSLAPDIVNRVEKTRHTGQRASATLQNALTNLLAAEVLSVSADVVGLFREAQTLTTDEPKMVGVRLGEASPRNYFVHQGQAKRLHFAGLRLEPQWLDVVELLCDPSLALEPTEELRLLRHYADASQPNVESANASFILGLRLAIWYRLVLADYLRAQGKTTRVASSNNTSSIPAWDSEASRRNFEALRALVVFDPSLQELRRALPN